MKKQVKKNLIAALSFAFIASLGVAGLVKTEVNAGAVDEVAVEGNFQMDDGAAIRVKSNTPSGIRWSVTVSESYYNYATSLGNAQWGMFVDNVAITNVDTNTTEVDIPLENQTLPEFDADDGVEETWTYYASITYDQLQADMQAAGKTTEQIATALEQAYATTLYARAYVHTDAGYQYAQDADTGRSIKGVAMHCLIEETSDVTTNNKSTFETYAGGAYTVAATQDFNNANAYNTTSGTGAFTASVTDGEYDAYFGAKYLGKSTATDGAIALTATGLGKTLISAGEMGEVRLVNAANEVTEVPFIAATHIIGDQASGVSDKDEWNAEMTYANTDGSLTTDWYVVVVKDMDFDGANLTKTRSSSRFAGRFNGLGHTLNDYLISGDQTGLFGGITTAAGATHGAIIENVALTNVTVSGTNAYPIAEYVYQTMHRLQNIYVQATYTSEGAYQGVWRNTGSAVVNNCIADLTYTTAPETAYAFAKDGKASYFYNCYAATNATTTLFSSSTVENQTTPATNVSTSMSSLISTIKADIQATTDNNWAKYWSCDDYSVYFGNNVVAKVAAQTKDMLYKTADFDIDLATLMDSETIDKVYVNGVATEVPAGNVLSIDWDSLTKGEVNQVEVWADGKIVVQPYVAVTSAISTINEFITFINGATNDDATIYAVLLNNIDYNDASRTVNLTEKSDSGTQFKGVFDGLGHTVSNLQVSGRGGVFGPFGGTVRNVAFVDIVNTRGTETNTSGILCGFSYSGSFENVYVRGSFKNERADCGINSRGNHIAWKNCVFDVTFVDGEATHYVLPNQPTANMMNVYAIGNATQISANNTTAPYLTAAAFVADKGAELAAVSADDYWTMDENNNLYFGDTKVE